MMFFPHQIVTIIGVFFLGTQALTTLAKCNADNCYRALFPCPTPSAVSSASEFCATITANGATATNFPFRATAACGTAPARYISACGCGPTCPIPTPSPTPCTSDRSLLTNSDFENGLSSWTVEVFDTKAKAGITSQAANCGLKSFEATLLSDRPGQDPVTSVRLNSSAISVQRNVPCRLNFAVWFDNMDAGFVGVRINGEPRRTVDARDSPGWGVWKTVSVDYTPDADKVLVSFDFLYGRVASIVRLDSVVFNYLR